MSLEGPPKNRAEFIPGRPEGTNARRVIGDTIHTQAYEVQLPDGETIPLSPADLAKEGIPWAGSETVTSADPAYQRIIEAAYRKREMAPPKKERPEAPQDEPAEEKSTHFIPGREPSAVAERLIAGDHGAFGIGEQRYRVRLPDGETIELGPEDLAAHGVVTEGSETIFPSHREYPNLIEAAHRKREGTTRKEMREELRNAIDAFVSVSVPHESEQELPQPPRPLSAYRYWRPPPIPETQSPERPKTRERAPSPEARQVRHEDNTHTHERREHEHAESDHHDHDDHHDRHGKHESHDHGAQSDLIAIALHGAWNLLKAIWKLHQWAIHAVGYILTGDNKHPWKTLWKNISGEFRKGLGLKGGGGGHGGGGHGGGHGH